MDDLSYRFIATVGMDNRKVAVLTLMDDLSYKIKNLKNYETSVAVLTLMDDLSYAQEGWKVSPPSVAVLTLMDDLSYVRVRRALLGNSSQSSL